MEENKKQLSNEETAKKEQLEKLHQQQEILHSMMNKGKNLRQFKHRYSHTHGGKTKKG